MADEQIVQEIARGAFRAALDTVRDWWNRKSKTPTEVGNQDIVDELPGIMIIGPGGTGKTTLAKLLAGDGHWLLDSPWEYRESHNVELFSLLDDPGVELVVPPGQSHRRSTTWNDVHTDLANGRYSGVIFVTAFGFHNLSGIRSYQQHPLYAKNKEKFFSSYLEDCQNEELRVLKLLAPHLKPNSRKMWLLTFVGKEDLWHPDRNAVEKHYREGEYSRVIEEILNHCGTAHFRHEYALGSLLILNLITDSAEMLRKNTEGYDHRIQVGTVRKLIETIYALKKWEESE